jgi:hypothetical protein
MNKMFEDKKDDVLSQSLWYYYPDYYTSNYFFMNGQSGKLFHNSRFLACLSIFSRRET